MGRFAIIKKKERWGVTWFGHFLKFLLLFILLWIYAKTAVPFLSPVEPENANIMIVEGFIPDYAIVEAMHLFENGNYDLMIISGKKRLKGAPLDQYTNDGDFSAATLEKLGFDTSRVRVVAVEDEIQKDRTYESAVAIFQWMKENKITANTLNLVTLGCHSRRSRLLFQKAFGNDFKIGILAISNQSYDAVHWWRSSHGFREVNKETIAWIYARFFFFP